jgi:hypothetical protein
MPGMGEINEPGEYPSQIDCVWLASDGVGNLAVFITAGIAPIPAIALSQAYGPILDVEEWVQRLPLTSAASDRHGIRGQGAFDEFAQRGLFAFDWTDVHRTGNYVHSYEKVASPTRPLPVSALTGTLLNCGSRLVLNTIDFSSTAAVNIKAVITCISPP